MESTVSTMATTLLVHYWSTLSANAITTQRQGQGPSLMVGHDVGQTINPSQQSCDSLHDG